MEPLSRVIDYPLLIGWGYDPTSGVFAPDRDHPLLGYPVCRVLGCGREAWEPDGLCGGCRIRFAAAGGDIDAFTAGGVTRANRTRDRQCLVCRVPGFERPVGTNDLCLACDGQRRRRRQSVAAYVTGDGELGPAAPGPGLGVCTVVACGRLAAHPETGLCGAHDGCGGIPGRPEIAVFVLTAPPCQPDRAGGVVLAGLPETVVAEVLCAIRASVAEGRRVMIKDVRGAVGLLRHSGARSLADVDTGGQRDPVRWFLRFAADRVALAQADPETEAVKDVWDMRVFGSAGRLSFVGSTTRRGTPSRPITQRWLKHARSTLGGAGVDRLISGPVRAVIAAVGLFSEHLGRRADAGADPAVLSHRDVAAFLARLTHLQQTGVLSAEMRARSINGVDRFLRDCREMGLTNPGGAFAALGDDVVIRRGERPRARRSEDEVGRAPRPDPRPRRARRTRRQHRRQHTPPQLADLEQALSEAKEQLAQRDQELAAARQINHELIGRLNRERTKPRPRT